MVNVPGPLFSIALSRFRSEVKREDDCVLDVTSAQELLRQTKAIEQQASTRTKRSTPSNRLEAILPHLNDFTAVIAVCGGADPKTTGLIWGSLRVIWTLAYPAGDVLDDILAMLDELSCSLPRFCACEETLPMNKALESALLDVYTEMICFCARTIGFLRSTTHRPLIRLGWSKLNEDFTQTSKHLKILSRIVDSEADAIRLRVDGKRNVELLGALEIMKDNHTNNERLPCHYVPFGIDEQFFGRDEILQRIKAVLDPPVEGYSRRKSLVLHGLGGVGKTKIALQYVNQSRHRFDAILWISADNSIKLTQSFLEASRRLGLTLEKSDSQDAVAAMSKVKAWLVETRCHWLLVFDNADEPELLVSAWPGDAAGSILVTSRDFTAGFGTSAEDCKVQPFDGETGVSAFLSLVGHDPKLESNRASAAKIVEVLGGLPLAINQISGFIAQHKLTLEEFLPLYTRSSERIHSRKLVRGDYEHTLSTVWDLALGRLSGPSRTLQILLAFFDPDRVHESVLLEGVEQIDDEDFEFLGDEIDFLESKDALLKAGLIDRFSEDATLAVHRLVQAAVMKRLSQVEKLKYFNRVVKLLGNGFPNTWNTVTSHQFSSWAKCERCLPHVNFLIVQSNRYKLTPTDPAEFTELILRCCWHVNPPQSSTCPWLTLLTRYLYEREHYNQARRFMQTALQFLSHDTVMFSSASMLQGLIELDTNNVRKALGSFLVALEIRERESVEDAFIASSLNAISLAYTELGDLVKAVETGQRAIDIRLRSNSDRIGNSYSNMASTLLRMGKPDEAEEMLKRCPSLKDFTDETFLQTNNPRFSGDMVLLSRIRKQQGKLDDALRLSSKALAFRQQLLGSRLKTCDSLYQVASLLQLRGDLSSAINLLEESVSIAENIPDEAGGYLARANFKLAQIYEALNEVERARVCREAAESIRRRISSDAVTNSDASEEAYDKLVLWMLW